MAKSPQVITSISVFFPCLNEEKNILPLTSKLLKILPKVTNKYEIIIVDDGSWDNTGKVAKVLEKKYSQVKLVTHSSNLGYGAAIKTGIDHSQYDWIFFTDGDGQFDVSQITRLIEFSRNYQVIIGYREKRADGQLRAANARIFKVFIDLLYRLHVRDIDCAFKLFKASTIKDLKLKTTGAMISTEILYKLKKKHISIKQVPVKHLPRVHGQPTGNNLGVVLKAGFESISLYLHLKFGSKT